MAEPLGKREQLVWTICGVLAVVAAIAYSRRSPEPAPIAPTTLPVSPPLQQPAPRGEAASPLTKREPTDTAWIRIGTLRPQTLLRINDVLRGEAREPKWWPVPAGDVKLWMNAPNCQAWDTTMHVERDARVTIGMRMPKC